MSERNDRSKLHGDPYPVCDRHLCGGCGDAWHNRCTPIPPPPERAILTDLIAELRELNQNRDGGMSSLIVRMTVECLISNAELNEVLRGVTGGDRR